MRKNRKPDGIPYVLCYVDNVLAISHDPNVIMDHLLSKYTMKDQSVQEPTKYLSTQVRRYKMDDGKIMWAMSSNLYVK